MKKLFQLFSVAAIVLVAAACEKSSVGETGEEVQVSYTVNLGSATKAVGDASNVNVVACAVYKINEDSNSTKTYSLIESTKNNVFVNGGAATYSPVLIKGQTYRIVFFAYHQEGATSVSCEYVAANAAYDVTDLSKVKANNYLNNNENLDAFAKYVDFTVGTEVNPSVVLVRPVAQLNIGVTEADWNNAVALGETPTLSGIKITVPVNEYNAVTGEVNSLNTSVELDYTKNSIVNATFNPKETGTQENVDYKYLSLTYVFATASGASTTADLALTIYNQSDAEMFKTTALTNIPLKANHKTNIYGTLMTGTVNYNISLDKGFDDEEINNDLDN